MSDFYNPWVVLGWGWLLYGLITLGFMLYVHFFVKQGDIHVEKDPEKVKVIEEGNKISSGNMKWKKALGVEPENDENDERPVSILETLMNTRVDT